MGRKKEYKNILVCLVVIAVVVACLSAYIRPESQAKSLHHAPRSENIRIRQQPVSPNSQIPFNETQDFIQARRHGARKSAMERPTEIAETKRSHTQSPQIQTRARHTEPSKNATEHPTETEGGKRIVLITAIFGAARPNLQFFLKSAEKSGIDVVIFGDPAPKFHLPANVVHVSMTWKQMLERIHAKVPECFTNEGKGWMEAIIKTRKVTTTLFWGTFESS
mmetsp:Transcript_77479/g.116451  ORF Transcript_77479/g.116451 Transcript_77479/m.116451 type:complete len:221 (+) Transcript_77479:120-782(+)